MYWVLGIALIMFFVMVHETGHFVVGRLVGVQFTDYSIGMGPTIKSWTRGGVKYQLSLFPVGGYVKPAVIEGTPCFELLPRWRALAFVLAGVTTNFAVAFVAFFILYWQLVHFSAWHSLVATSEDFWSLLTAIPAMIFGIIMHPVHNTGVAGPTETFTMARNSVDGFHWERILFFTGLINVGLAVVNLLPVMPLDGGNAVRILMRSERRWVSRLRTTFTVVGVAWFVVFLMSNAVIPFFQKIFGP